MGKEIVLSKGDYVLLSSFIRNNTKGIVDNNLEKLADELENARIVSQEELPKDVVKFNSEVTLMDVHNMNKIIVKLVMPINADITRNQISIFAPLSAALLGYKKGDRVEWEMPAGTKKYEILEVCD